MWQRWWKRRSASGPLRRAADVASHRAPAQTEARQVLTKTVGVVGRRFSRSRSGEQPPAGLGQAGRRPAHTRDGRELRAVEQIERCDAVRRHYLAKQDVIVIALAPAVPHFGEALDLVIYDIVGDSATWSQCGHTQYRAIEVAKVSGPDRVGGGRKRQKPVARVATHRDSQSCDLRCVG